MGVTCVVWLLRRARDGDHLVEHLRQSREVGRRDVVSPELVGRRRDRFQLLLVYVRRYSDGKNLHVKSTGRLTNGGQLFWYKRNSRFTMSHCLAVKAKFILFTLTRTITLTVTQTLCVPGQYLCIA